MSENRISRKEIECGDDDQAKKPKKSRKVVKVDLTPSLSSSTFSTSTTDNSDISETGAQDDLAKAVSLEENCYPMDIVEYNLLLNESYTGSFTEDMQHSFSGFCDF